MAVAVTLWAVDCSKPLQVKAAVQLASDLLSDRVGEEDFEVLELSEKQADWASLCDLKP